MIFALHKVIKNSVRTLRADAAQHSSRQSLATGADWLSQQRR